MLFRISLIVMSLIFSTSAYACIITQDTPSQRDLQKLIALDKNITRESALKTEIDAAVWGVFLNQPSKAIFQDGYVRFKVGGVSKGYPDEIIKLVSSKRNVTIETQIYYLNLRKIDKSLWTDVGVTQQKLDWGREICKHSPNSTRCKLHHLKQDTFKASCEMFIREIYYGCLSLSALPERCREYMDTAFDD